MTKVKICGITGMEDAVAAFEAGADALGFIFWEKSRRNVSPATAARIVKELGPFISTVGVFVNEPRENIKNIVETTSISAVQLHGEEAPGDCRGMGVNVIKAFRVKDRSVLDEMARFTVSAFLLDTYREGLQGGTGEVFDWDIAAEAAKSGLVILSGGLNPENVAEAIRRVSPYAVDCNSGVEAAPGRKDHEKIRKFIEAARGAKKYRWIGRHKPTW